MNSINKIDNRIKNLDFKNLLEPLNELKSCNLCPRNCNADRFSETLGYCNADAGFNISSICIHKGEEPPISGKNGICNIFFTNCNLQCIYCQNYQISNNNLDHRSDKMTLETVLKSIIKILDQGINSIGFVSPSHFIPQVKIIIKAIKMLGYNPTFVYNSNAYDKVEILKSFEGLIDVYLPDFKYMDGNISNEFSDAQNYPEIALNAIKEMYLQVGDNLIVDNNGIAISGMIIRHLVLPGYVDNSINVLKKIAENISTNIHISLMSQYYPTYKVAGHPKLCRTLKTNEYQKVVNELEMLGFSYGWVQDISSHENYRPDFFKEKPFE
ncbi:MAG: 4Fe-4S cluster-binding domain-containing protein [Bacteroidales bacterium]|nr:4Fe-4S cluster-binding domain-containing protein [Bacteroidales bacterium]